MSEQHTSKIHHQGGIPVLALVQDFFFKNFTTYTLKIPLPQQQQIQQHNQNLQPVHHSLFSMIPSAHLAKLQMYPVQMRSSCTSPEHIEQVVEFPSCFGGRWIPRLCFRVHALIYSFVLAGTREIFPSPRKNRSGHPCNSGC
jgi:hypothetical protein